MNNLLKATLVPAFTYLAGRASSSLSAASGPYAGVDVSTGQAFAGLQGRLNPDGAPVQVTPSVEGNAPGTAASRWQANADVLFPFAPSRAPWQPYAGAGLCLVGSAGGTSAGLNLVGGVNVDLGPLNGFVQARITVADGFHLSLTGGALPSGA